MKKNRIRLTESQLHEVIKESVNRILSEGNKYVRGGNQQYASAEKLQNDRAKIPQYFNELMNTGETYVSYCDDDFYKFLQDKGIKFNVKVCADYFERTKFTLLN